MGNPFQPAAYYNTKRQRTHIRTVPWGGTCPLPPGEACFPLSLCPWLPSRRRLTASHHLPLRLQGATEAPSRASLALQGSRATEETFRVNGCSSLVFLPDSCPGIFITERENKKEIKRRSVGEQRWRMIVLWIHKALALGKTFISARTCPRAHTHALAQEHTHTHTPDDTQTHTRVYTNTHTHTHT